VSRSSRHSPRQRPLSPSSTSTSGSGARRARLRKGESTTSLTSEPSRHFPQRQLQRGNSSPAVTSGLPEAGKGAGRGRRSRRNTHSSAGGLNQPASPATHSDDDGDGRRGSPFANIPRVTQTVQVGVRVRPLIQEETSRGHVTQAWEIEENVIREREINMRELTPEERMACGVNRDGSFRFEHLFGTDSTNAQIYEQLAKPIVANVCEGYNGTLFAYGQTSSGKTHTVMGNEKSLGVLFLALEDVFEHVSAPSNRTFSLRVQYVEIYNEQVKDLLDPKKVSVAGAGVRHFFLLFFGSCTPPFCCFFWPRSDRCVPRCVLCALCCVRVVCLALRVLLVASVVQDNLRVFEDPKRGPMIHGVTERKLEDADDAVNVISVGEKNRHISSTLMNRQSSRSHTICRLELTSREVRVDGPAGSGNATAAAAGTSATTPGHRKTVSVRQSVLCIVDLAGSERASKTGATGARLKEASHINKSLMTLGTIISQLSQGRDKHPPFRDSKLTRLLSNALGGNALTGLVCCVSPALRNREETRWVQTLVHVRRVVGMCGALFMRVCASLAFCLLSFSVLTTLVFDTTVIDTTVIAITVCGWGTGQPWNLRPGPNASATKHVEMKP